MSYFTFFPIVLFYVFLSYFSFFLLYVFCPILRFVCPISRFLPCCTFLSYFRFLPCFTFLWPCFTFLNYFTFFWPCFFFVLFYVFCPLLRFWYRTTGCQKKNQSLIPRNIFFKFLAFCFVIYQNQWPYLVNHAKRFQQFSISSSIYLPIHFFTWQ